jgi:hypothetical protein
LYLLADQKCHSHHQILISDGVKISTTAEKKLIFLIEYGRFQRETRGEGGEKGEMRIGY